MLGHSKSPVDELVDGIDAIGSILDENLPQIKSRLDDLTTRQADFALKLNEFHATLKSVDDEFAGIQKLLTNLDVRVEEIMATIGAVSRRLDQMQKAVMDLTLLTERKVDDSELADTVKVLEDRLRRLETGRPGGI
jgi:archaellum component FlaC